MRFLMSLWTRLADRLVPPSALSSWTVPLRRVDSLRDKIGQASPPSTGSDGLFSGHRVVLTELAAEGHAVHIGGRIVVNPLTWKGGLAPWPPNG